MVYAMMSIGILGFIVWSQLVAFLIREDKVINFTVGWNGYLILFLNTVLSISFLCYIKLGNLVDTFYSLNSTRKARSAGNLCLPYYKEDLEGSSETIRENTYDLFKWNFAFFFKEEFKQDNNWLSWFIGFLEGDGAILEHKGRSSLVLTQKDDTVLHEIYKTLKIGKVKHFYDNKGNQKYSRYIVSDNKSIFLLYLLLNGNLVLQSRVNQLTKWNTALNNASKFQYSLFYTQEVPKKIEMVKESSLNDGWLSGFTDAEGCFSVKIEGGRLRRQNYVKLLFILDQKNEEVVLNKISLLFSSVTKAKLRTINKYVKVQNLVNYSNNMFRLSLSCNDTKKKTIYEILDYFNKHPLKTTKNVSFQVWKEISYIVLGKQPLSVENLSKVRKLRHNMNYFTISNNPIARANKS